LLSGVSFSFEASGTDNEETRSLLNNESFQDLLGYLKADDNFDSLTLAPSKDLINPKKSAVITIMFGAGLKVTRMASIESATQDRSAFLMLLSKMEDVCGISS